MQVNLDESPILAQRFEELLTMPSIAMFRHGKVGVSDQNVWKRMTEYEQYFFLIRVT